MDDHSESDVFDQQIEMAPASPPMVTPVPVVDEQPAPTTPGTGPVSPNAPAGDPVPSDAVAVASNGNDQNSGTWDDPFRTMSRAVAVARSGATIVVRQGTYHEAFQIPTNKALTIRSAPGETVWFDGSEPITGWTRDGSNWRFDNWTINFDNSPTYRRGAPDKTEVDWTFVNPAHPMAAHPDQVWIDDVPQRQVGSVAEVQPGTFFEDSTTKKLYLGSDPTGHEVRASTLGRAVLAQGPDTTIRGINFRRFSPSVPDMGGVVFTGQRATISDAVISEMATTGLAVINTDSVIRNVEIAYSGMLGIHAATADRLLLDGVSSHHNNTERFNTAPVSGGFKFGLLRGITIRNSSFRDNWGPGVWADESPYDMTIVNSDFRDNVGHGISLEISAKALVANNLISNNGGFGIKVNNTSEVRIINNTFIGNDRSVNIVQDPRTPQNTSYGHNRTRPLPDPTMPWVIGPVLVQGNIIAHQTRGNCMLCVEDYSSRFTAEQLQVQATGNLYSEPTAGSVKYFIVWSRGAGNPAVYKNVAAFNAATGQEAQGRYTTGTAPVDAAGRAAGSADLSGAPTVPADVATVASLSTVSKQFGAQR